jgi:alanine dehydrogenase
MIVGVLKEVKDNENRVAITQSGAQKLINAGHEVLIESNAGTGSGISNEQYMESGAEILKNKNDLCEKAELILKIKEPVPAEYGIFRPGQMLFTFFHFASSKQLTEAMINSKVTCIAYETVETSDSRFPLLSPMSEVAGKIASIVAANYLSKSFGGKGVLASSVGSIKPARFVILGGGTVGRAAAAVAFGMGAEVTIIDKNRSLIDSLRQVFPQYSFVFSTHENIKKHVREADVLIGAVYAAGAKAPKLVSREMVREMEQGSVIVDAAIDQGGCIETSRPSIHSSPVYTEEGVVHYCVTNMPGAFPRTSTFALTDETLPYVVELADKGIMSFKNLELLRGLNLYKGKVTNKAVAEAHGLPYTDPKELLC